MIEIGVFHNGASDLPIRETSSGIKLVDGSLSDVHESARRTILNQVRQGILAVGGIVDLGRRTADLPRCDD